MAAVSCANRGRDQADDAAPIGTSKSPASPPQPAPVVPATPGTSGPSNATSPSTAAPAATPVAWPNLNFVNDPGGHDPKAVALTFDDGPDGAGSPQGKAGKTNMSSVLDVLDKYGLKATFFLCGNMWTNAATDVLAQADVKRMVAAGHHYGSHTATHPTFDPSVVSAQKVQTEFATNQNIFLSPNLLGPSGVFTLYRAPYGVPFQDGMVYPPTATSVNASVGVLAPGTPANAVHVGWGIDTHDWQCAQNNSDSNCILSNLNEFLDHGASGPILMHAVYQLTAQTLPQIIASIYSHGYHIVMVEDLVQAKYGASSAAIAKANAAASFEAATISQAAVAATLADKWYKQTNED